MAGEGLAFLAAKTPPATLLSCSKLAEAAVELAVVPAVHVAVPVEVEVPEATGLAGAFLERGAEEVAIGLIHAPVAVAVADHPLEAARAHAPGRTVPGPVPVPPLPRAVHDRPNPL